MSSPTGKLFAVCAALCKLPCKYKQRSLAVLSLIMEVVSIVLDKYEKKLLVVLAAFLLAVVGFAISLFPVIKKNARLQNSKELQVVQFFLSLIQLVAAFCQLVLTFSNEEDKIDFLMYFPSAIAAIAVIFAFKKNAEQSDSPLPLTILRSYNSVPGSPESGSDWIRISMGEENELFARLICTHNNFVLGSTPMEPDGHNGISTDEENVESPLTSSEPATLPGSTPIEPDGQNRISIDAENAELPLERSEPASLPSRTPIEPDGVFVDQVSSVSSLRRRSNIARNITSVDLNIWHNNIWDVPDRLLEDEPYPWPQLPRRDEPRFKRQPLIEKKMEKKMELPLIEKKMDKKMFQQMLSQRIRELSIDEKMSPIEEHMRQISMQEQASRILQQHTETQTELTLEDEPWYPWLELLQLSQLITELSIDKKMSPIEEKMLETEEKASPILLKEARGIWQQYHEARGIWQQYHEARRILRQLYHEAMRILQQHTEPQASASKPYKKVAHMRNMKPVANVARPSATTIRRRGKRTM